MIPDYDAIEIGYQLPQLTSDPITRSQMALFQGGSGDHNPIHTDIDFAKKSGLDDVIVFGMFVKAYLGRMLTNAVPQEAIKEIDIRFSAMTFIGDVITSTAIVDKKEVLDGEKLLHLKVAVTRQNGDVLLNGTALIKAT